MPIQRENESLFGVQDSRGQYQIREYQFKYNEFVFVNKTEVDMAVLNVTFLPYKQLMFMCSEDHKLIVKHYPAQQEKCILDKNMLFSFKLFNFNQKVYVHNNRQILELSTS